MDINNDRNIINELEIALKYYIKGIIINSAGTNNWIEPIQRMTEHALLKYTIIDKKQKNFLELQKVVYKSNIINIILNNEKCNYKKDKKEIKILIPCKDEVNKMYILNGSPKIII